LALAVVAVVVVLEEEKEEMVEVEGESLKVLMDDGEGGSAEVALRTCSDNAVEEDGGK